MKIKKQNVLVIIASTIFSVSVYWFSLRWLFFKLSPYICTIFNICEMELLLAAPLFMLIPITALIVCVVYLSRKLLESPSTLLILVNIVVTFILSYTFLTVQGKIEWWYQDHDPNIIRKSETGEISNPSECSKLWDETRTSLCLINIARNKKSCAFIENTLLKNECEDKLYEESEAIPLRYTNILYCEKNEDCKAVFIGCNDQKIVNRYYYEEEKERSYGIYPMEERVKCYSQRKQVECDLFKNKCIFLKNE